VVNAPRPSAKVGIVFLGLVLALVVAWVAVFLRQLATQGPAAQASAGMYAFGDLMLGVAVFGVLAVVPIALALYWLRPVALFWSALLWGALLFALTGIGALAANHWATPSTGSWIFLAQVRVGLMPLSALALVTCALFAPRPRHRWLLLAAAFTDGAIFAGVLFVKVALPHLGGG
jgi:hypothetical protein